MNRTGYFRRFKSSPEGFSRHQFTNLAKRVSKLEKEGMGQDSEKGNLFGKKYGQDVSTCYIILLAFVPRILRTMEKTIDKKGSGVLNRT